MSNPWDKVPALTSNLPDPIQLQRALKDRIQAAYATLYEQRGRVDTPEDTYEMQRKLATTDEQFKGYMTAFREARKVIAQLQQEELVEARGEQDGIPLDGLTVPDRDGDIRLSLDAPAVYDIDLEQLLAVLLTNIMDRAPVADDVELIPYAVGETAAALLSWGKFEPQVSKVKAFAATLARNGRDKDASVVSGAITQRNPYKGVKFERTKPR